MPTDADCLTPENSKFPTFEIKAIPVAAVDLAFATDFIARRCSRSNGEYITVTGAHGIVESAYDPRILEAHQQALMVVPDGMPLVWLGKILGHPSVGRVYGPDLMQHVFAAESCRRLRHFFYGSTPAVIERLLNKLRRRFGEFNVVGSHCPPMRPLGFRENDQVLDMIRETKPDLIWVGLSTPKQELWMRTHMPEIGTGIGIGVGAAFDLIAGTTRQAPRWVQRSGLEWAFRLAVEPRRLYRRYLKVVPMFLHFSAGTLVRRFLAFPLRDAHKLS